VPALNGAGEGGSGCLALSRERRGSVDRCVLDVSGVVRTVERAFFDTHSVLDVNRTANTRL
jgi:hypothetical protein